MKRYHIMNGWKHLGFNLFRYPKAFFSYKNTKHVIDISILGFVIFWYKDNE